MHSQRGFAHILGLILLLAGLVAAVYLVQTKTNWLPKASELKPVKEEPDYVSKSSLADGKPVYSYSISGQISFKKGNSYVRAVLIDDKNNEYLVYEAYPIITDSNSFTVTNVCEETCYLDGIVPKSLRIEGNSSSLNITQTSFSDKLPSAVQVKDIPTKAAEVKAEKDQGKIKKIASAATQKKIKWTAGETSVSKMTYAQKRKLFPGIEDKKLDYLPNLQGWEYYRGGIFEFGTGNTYAPASSNFPTQWDWRNRHGENWMTPPKNQKNCGSCWVFGATGATEAVANLYFNQHLDLDLSEQDSLSCSGGGNCIIGGVPQKVFQYQTETGVVPENCFPYQDSQVSCSNKCSDWQSQVVKINGFQEYFWPTEETIKQSIISKGPVASGFTIRTPMPHIMSLIGWQTDFADGATIWVYKDSFGPDWGEEGYFRAKGTLSGFSSVDSPVTIANNHSLEVVCVDKDNDGYYNWGIGPKPATCPDSSRVEEDCDDSNSSFGTFDSHYNCISIEVQTTPSPTPAPFFFNCTSCAADINHDNWVNITDFSYISGCYNKSSTEIMSNGKPCAPADLDRDGFVNSRDIICVGNQYGKGCLLTPASDPANYKRVFVTSHLYSSNLGGLSGADSKCQERSEAAHLGGVWKAWLSDGVTSASSRLQHSQVPYKLINRVTIANNWADLTDGTIRSSINLTETQDNQPFSAVWTNTKSDGSIKQLGVSCVNWNSTSNELISIGSNQSADRDWTDSLYERQYCNRTGSLYCFEQ